MPEPPPYARVPELKKGVWYDGEFWFDEAAADFAVIFIEQLTHVKAEWDGLPLKLEKWESDVIRAAFGWKRADGTRRYRIVFVEVPRKNGKSTLAAGVALLLLFADDEPGAEVYGAAVDRPQARVIFEIAAAMVQNNRGLAERAIIYRNAIVLPESGSTYKVLSADVPSKHGLNPHGVVFDELHTQPNRKLWDVLRSGRHSRRQPLTFVCTTAGWDVHSICYKLHTRAEQIRDGQVPDDTLLPVIYAAPKDADWKNEKVWHAANPCLGVSKKLDAMREDFEVAVHDPEEENTFRRDHLNQWTEQAVRWMNMDKWDGCKFKLPSLARRPCFGGLDLSAVGDLTAFVLVFPPWEEDEEIWWIKPWFFIPGEAVERRAERDMVPYPTWVRRGLIEPTPGDVVDYDRLRARVNDEAERYDMLELAIDDWNATQISTQLAADGHKVVPVRMGWKSMTSPTKFLQRLVRESKIGHGGHEVLRWNASNVAVKTDANENVMPAKDKSIERIDGIVACIIALGRAMIAFDEGMSVYNQRGLEFV